MSMVCIVFRNRDAHDKVIEIMTTGPCVRNILAWYGAYFAGDKYTVAIDGKQVKIDQNGELVE